MLSPVCAHFTQHTPEIFLIKSFRSITGSTSDRNKKMRKKKSAAASLVEQLDENPLKSQHSRAKAIPGKTEMKAKLECRTWTLP